MPASQGSEVFPSYLLEPISISRLGASIRIGV